MSYAKEKGLVDGEARVFATESARRHRPRTNPARIGSLQDLRAPRTKVVLAAEAVPVGKYSAKHCRTWPARLGSAPEYDRKGSPTWCRRRRT